MIFQNAGPRWFPVRMATQRIYVDGKSLLIQVADPQAKFHNVLTEFYSALFFALPPVLVLAALGGYWLSGRALAPVDQIIDEARAIDPSNLTARLSVPSSGDELQRLSETLNQLLQRVQESVLHVRRFTADASHELRAPMTLIYTAAQFALRRDRSADELKEALRKILREAQRSTELINQLLWLARTDAGTSAPQLVPTDLKRVVEEVAGEAAMLAASKEQTIAVHVSNSAQYADVDEASFRRMLLILLDNAIKYTPEQGKITIGVVDDAGRLAVSIQDTGTGILAEELPFIFDRFWRADKVRSRDGGGTGLGLAIAREIAMSHGAELMAESSVGAGSTFTIRLAPSRRDLMQAVVASDERA